MSGVSPMCQKCLTLFHSKARQQAFPGLRTSLLLCTVSLSLSLFCHKLFAYSKLVPAHEWGRNFGLEVLLKETDAMNRRSIRADRHVLKWMQRGVHASLIIYRFIHSRQPCSFYMFYLSAFVYLPIYFCQL